MQIKLGKTYKTRLSGRKVAIFGRLKNPKDQTPYMGIDEDGDLVQYSEMGRFNVRKESCLDLVEESEKQLSTFESVELI